MRYESPVLISIPAHVLRMYRDAAATGRRRAEVYRSGLLMYGQPWRAQIETAEWYRQNRERIAGAVATLHLIRDNAPAGVNMADVKRAAESSR